MNFISVSLSFLIHKMGMIRNSLAVQWLGLRAFTAQGLGSTPCQGTKIPQSRVARPKKKKKGRNDDIGPTSYLSADANLK